MSKISIYILLILLFLGISKSFSPKQKVFTYIDNRNVLPHFFPSEHTGIILLGFNNSGYFIKTHYMHLKIIHSFRAPEYKVVRTSRAFLENNKNFVGLSIFRRAEITDNKSTESILPTPPGSFYVGNQAFGKWVLQDSGKKIWNFYRIYKHYPDLFGWGTFRPDTEFHKIMELHKSKAQIFYGINNEFGTQGSVTKEFLISNFNTKKKPQKTFKKYLASLFKTTSHWIKNE